MSTLATWDKISGALGSTTTTFGGEWGNLISDFMNGVDIGLSDPNKRPRPNTLTRFKLEKLGLFDGDESHYVTFSVADIDTGGVRKIIIRRMNSPNETDYMVMENLSQTLAGKTMDFGTANTATNIPASALASDSVTNVKIQDGAVNANKLADNAVTNAKMADNAVGTAELIDANVTLAILASDSVDSSKIVADSIMNSDINSSAGIGWAKLSKTGSTLDDLEDVVFTSVASQDIMIRNASNQWVNLAKGNSNEVLTLNISSVFVWDTIDDAIINTQTSTKCSITAKGQLNSSLLYSDQDNALGAHYYDIDLMTAPAAPAAGKLRVFADNGTGELSTQHNAGTVVKMSDGTGGGGGAPTSAQYVTLATDATLSAERVLTAGSGISITDGGANSTATVAINTAVTANLTSTQTLSGKTFNGLKLNRATKTASTYTLTSTDNIILADATSNNITLSLPAVSGTDGQVYHIQKVDSSTNTVTIDPNASEQINGATTMVLNQQYQGVIIWSNNSAWFTYPNVNEKVGKSTGNGGGTSFTIAHGMGTTPTYVFVQMYGPDIMAIKYSWDGTNITVTTASNTTSGTGNILFVWRCIV